MTLYKPDPDESSEEAEREAWELIGDLDGEGAYDRVPQERPVKLWRIRVRGRVFEGVRFTRVLRSFEQTREVIPSRLVSKLGRPLGESEGRSDPAVRDAIMDTVRDYMEGASPDVVVISSITVRPIYAD